MGIILNVIKSGVNRCLTQQTQEVTRVLIKLIYIIGGSSLITSYFLKFLFFILSEILSVGRTHE